MESKKGLTYFTADASSAGKLLFSGSTSIAVFSTFFCLQKPRKVATQRRIFLTNQKGSFLGKLCDYNVKYQDENSKPMTAHFKNQHA